MRGSLVYAVIFGAVCASVVAAAAVKEKLSCPSSYEGKDVLYQKADNCSEFYKCGGDGKLYTIPCQRGLYYCPDNEWCDYAANCDLSGCKMTPEEELPTDEDKEEEEDKNEGEEQVEGGEEGEMYCPSDRDGNEILYPKADNCQEYYQCYYGKLYQLSCRDGLYYCPSTKWCDYAENCDTKDCKMPSTGNAEEEDNNEKEESGTDDNDGGDGDVEEVEMYCPSDRDGNEILYPKADNCQQYYQCYYGKLYLLSCRAGLYYCPSTKWCDYAENCDTKDCKMPSTGNVEEEDNNEKEDGKDDNEGDGEDVDGELYCPPSWTGEDFLYQKADNCSEFYKCGDDGELHTIPCQKGLYYCAVNKWCDYADNCDYSGCKMPQEQDESSNKNQDIEIKGEEKQESGNDKVDNNDDPDDEYKEGLHCPSDNEDIILYPKPSNCSEFYQCAYGHIFTHRCQQGLYYCPEKEWCDYADSCDLSQCILTVTNEGSDDNQKNDKEEQNEAEQSGGDAGSNNSGVTCQSEGGLYPDPDDCSNFYQCSLGRAYLKVCPAGLYFCASKNVCDYPTTCDYSSCTVR